MNRRKSSLAAIIVILAALGGFWMLNKKPAVQNPATPVAQTESTTPAAETKSSTETEAAKKATPAKPEVKHEPPTKAEIAATKAAGTRRAVIKTDKGEITVELYGKDAPLTVANFVKLAKSKYYDGLTFHRVEPGFVIQGGDPEGNGHGGPGYSIALEIAPKLRHVKGALAMARSQDPDSAGSQFYITLDESPSTENLNGSYAVFGKVVSGMDVVQNITVGDTMSAVTVK